MTMYPTVARVIKAISLMSVLRGQAGQWYVYCRGCSRMIAQDLPVQITALTTAQAHSTVHTDILSGKKGKS